MTDPVRAELHLGIVSGAGKDFLCTGREALCLWSSFHLRGKLDGQSEMEALCAGGVAVLAEAGWWHLLWHLLAVGWPG